MRDSLRMRIKFEDENHPASLFSETKINKNFDISNLGMRMNEDLNYIN